ncbi:Tuftelin-interacting protein 11 [Hypsibius exemplaris]|uniref:Tuftelin-interacting protein 11 n=1 Tax=Hypsibius exemplaris TaxID=2072580 RepID=A0A1W0XDA5_HYPEX|nr:Tuftelin-interacting protein 11 [Hypsibius exemplaris]
MVERFEVTDDDYRDALDPTSRKRRKFTKDDAIYGMWADGDSDEDKPSFGGGGGGGKKNRGADYSAPLSFVSGGVKEGSEKGKNRVHDEDEVSFVSSPKTPKTEGSGKRGGGKAKTFAGLGMEMNKDFGKWEKNTKGIGLKLMGKMGFKPGQGLGKEGEGITKPIEVVVRKGKGAIGAYGSEKVRDPREVDVEQPSVQPARRAAVQQSKQWRKKDGADVPNYRFRTVEEVLEDKESKVAGGWDTSELSKVKVIDMTGKETRVLSGYHAMHTQRDRDDDDGPERIFDVAELRHNLDLLIDLSEARIVESNKKLEYEKNLAASLEDEQKVLTEDKERDDYHVGRLNVVFDMIDRLVANQDTMSLDDCLGIFNNLYDHHQEDYRSFEFDQLAAAIVSPIMARYLMHWDPLVDPTFAMREIIEWRRLLEPNQRSFEVARTTGNPFQNVLWTAWMPPVRQAVLRWSPRSFVDNDPILRLVKAWDHGMQDDILEQLVLPRLIAETEAWDPTVDPVPIHHWIHPWLEVQSFSSRLEVLYGTIRQKLSVALTQWKPIDPSARLMVEPWVDVFSPATLEQFLLRNILPKLHEVMERMVINPRSQILDPWNWTMEWSKLMPVSAMAALLEKHFFPKWLAVLDAWLARNPDMEEIPNWYSGWKGMIPEKLREHPSVQENLTKALIRMAGAIDDDDDEPLSPPTPAPLPPMPQQQQPPPPPPPLLPNPGVTLGYINSAPTFKDVVGRRAEELGAIFMPVVGKNYHGKQVFRFGSQNISIDRDVIFVQRGTNWVPIGLEELTRSSL